MTNERTVAELKACPWCNEALEYKESVALALIPPAPSHEYRHRNKNCPVGYRSYGFINNDEGHAAFREQWNARTPDPAIDKLAEALREARKFVHPLNGAEVIVQIDQALALFSNGGREK